MKVIPLNDKILVRRVEAEDKTSGAWLFTSIVGSALLLPSAVLLANSRRCRRSHRHPFT